MNVLDHAIAAISPAWAARRLRYRMAIQAYQTGTSRLRTPTKQTKGPNNAVKTAIKPMRERIRLMEEDYDIVVGVLNAYVTNVVGGGISVEPQPKTLDGEMHTEFAQELLAAWRDFTRSPETTGELDLGGLERLACRTWCRDGEVFGVHRVGRVGGMMHGTLVPYSVEVVEPDYVPLDLEDAKRNLFAGIERDKWGRAKTYYFSVEHPGDATSASSSYNAVKAELVVHLKHAMRIRQSRGVSMLAPVVSRLHDIKDYEESERVAARIAAAMAVFIKKGTPDMYASAVETDDDGNRLFDIAPGMIWDNLYPGEDIGTIQSNRPSNLLQPFRDAMLKAVAAGTGTSYSTIAKDYSGTYSSQRQELVEQFMSYNAATANFVAQWSRPIYRQFVAAYLVARNSIVQGAGPVPTDLDPISIDDAEYRGPVMPWIDPAKESRASIEQVQAGFKSRAQVIRERGGNPESVFNEILRERTRDYDNAMIFVSDYSSLAQRGEADPDPRTQNGVQDDDEARQAQEDAA